MGDEGHVLGGDVILRPSHELITSGSARIVYLVTISPTGGHRQDEKSKSKHGNYQHDHDGINYSVDDKTSMKNLVR